MSESGLQGGDRIEASLLACERNIEAIKQKMLASRQKLASTQDPERRQELVDYQGRLKQKLNQELSRVRKLEDMLAPRAPEVPPPRARFAPPPESGGDVVSMWQERSILMGEVEGLRIRLATQQQHINSLEEIVERFEGEEADSAHLAKRLETMRTERDALQTRVWSLQDELATAQQQVESLKHTETQLSEQEIVLHEALGEATRLRALAEDTARRLAAADERIARLTAELAENNQLFTLGEDERSQLQRQLAEARRDLEALGERSASLAHRSQELESTHEGLRRERDAEERGRRLVQHELQQLLAENLELTGRQAVLADERDRLQARVEAAERELAHLVAGRADLEIRRDQLQKSRSELEESWKELNARVVAQSRELRELASARSHAEHGEEMWRDRYEQLKLGEEDRAREFERRLERIQELENERDALRDRLDGSTRERSQWERMVELSERESAAWDEQHTVLETLIAELQKDRHQVLRQLDDMADVEHELEFLRGEVARLHNVEKRLQLELEESVSRLQQELQTRHDAEVQALTAEAQELRDTLAGLQDDLELGRMAQTELEVEGRRRIQLEGHIRELTQLRETLSEQYYKQQDDAEARLRQEVARREAQLEEVRAEGARLVEEAQAEGARRLEEALAEAARQLEEAQARHQAEVERLTAEAGRLRAQAEAELREWARAELELEARKRTQLEARLRELAEIREGLSEQLLSVSQQASEQDERASELTAALMASEDALLRAEGRVDAEALARQELEERFYELQAQVEAHPEQLRALQLHGEELHERLLEESAELSRVQARLRDYEGQLEAARSQRRAPERELAALQSESRELRRQLESAQAEAMLRESQALTWQSQLEESQERVNDMEARVFSAGATHADLEAQLAIQQTEHLVLERSHQQAREELEEERRLRLELDEEWRDLHTHSLDLASQLAALTQAQQRLQKERDELARRVEAGETEIRRLLQLEQSWEEQQRYAADHRLLAERTLREQFEATLQQVREEAAQVQAARDQTEQVLRQELHNALNRLESAESALTAAWEGSELLAEGRDQLETALADADLRLRRQEEQLSELEALRVRVQGLEASDAEERLEEAQLKLLEQEELLAKAVERERFLEAELAQARKRERKK